MLVWSSCSDAVVLLIQERVFPSLFSKHFAQLMIQSFCFKHKSPSRWNLARKLSLALIKMKLWKYKQWTSKEKLGWDLWTCILPTLLIPQFITGEGVNICKADYLQQSLVFDAIFLYICRRAASGPHIKSSQTFGNDWITLHNKPLALERPEPSHQTEAQAPSFLNITLHQTLQLAWCHHRPTFQSQSCFQDRANFLPWLN